MNALAAIEAFFGVLYAGFASAVIFGKLIRIQALARVRWSDPIVVRYGTGVEVEALDNTPAENGAAGNDSDDASEDLGTLIKKYPCPILEFRVINECSHMEGGEIVNASITVWASTLAEMAKDSVRAAANLPGIHVMEPEKTTQKDGRKSFMQVGVNMANVVATTAKRTVGVAQKAGKATADAAQKASKATLDVAQKAGKATADVAQKASKATLGAAQKAGKATMDVAQKAGDFVVPRSSSHKPPVASEEPTLHDVETPPDPPISPEATFQERMAKERQELIDDVRKLTESNRHIALTEDPTNGLIPQMIYSKLDIETDSHPFFKRVWIIRHKLDENSPLLSSVASDMIKANEGYWPEELSSYEKVREHIQFNEIMVTLNGTSNVSGTNVYSQKTYDFVDVNIGYRFANTLVQDPKTKQIGVDISLINDVLEQHGGGAEPFTDVVAGDDGFITINFDEVSGNVTRPVRDAAHTAVRHATGYAVTTATKAGDVIGTTSQKAGDLAGDLANVALNTAGDAVSQAKQRMASRGGTTGHAEMQLDPTKEN